MRGDLSYDEVKATAEELQAQGAAPTAENVTLVAPVAMRLPGEAPQLLTGYCQ